MSKGTDGVMGCNQTKTGGKQRAWTWKTTQVEKHNDGDICAQPI